MLRLASICLMLFCATAFAGEVSLRGKIVDEKGLPLAFAEVQATAPSMGRTLWWAQCKLLRARSDSAGEFQLTLPCADVMYLLSVTRCGYIQTHPCNPVVTEGIAETRIVMRRGDPKQTIKGHISADGNSASKLLVTLRGEYGFEAAAQTDDDGDFEFEELSDELGQGVLIAKRDDLLLPIRIVRAEEKEPLDLTLAPAATLSGTVREAADGALLPNVRVTLRTWAMTGFLRSTVSDDKGEWKLTDVPGGEYLIDLDGPEHFEKPRVGDALDRAVIKLGPGENRTISSDLNRKASLSGVVISATGRAVADALVATTCTWDGDYRDQVRWVRCDKQGRFAIKTGHLDEQLMLAAFDPVGGLCEIQIANLAEDEKREHLRIALPGSVRVKGTLADPAGKGIPEVTCATKWWPEVRVQSDAGGHFDFGRLPLAGPNANYAIALTCPAPRAEPDTMVIDETNKSQLAQQRTDTDAATRTFFVDDKIFVDRAADAVDLKKMLQPTDLLTVTGRVVDANGAAIPATVVHLFEDNADDAWNEKVELRGFGGNLAVVDHSHARLLGSAACKSGEFRLFARRSDGHKVIGGVRFSIGVVIDGKGRKLVTDVIVPDEKTSATVDVQIER